MAYDVGIRPKVGDAVILRGCAYDVVYVDHRVLSFSLAEMSSVTIPLDELECLDADAEQSVWRRKQEAEVP